MPASITSVILRVSLGSKKYLGSVAKIIKKAVVSTTMRLLAFYVPAVTETSLMQIEMHSAAR
jgi:hypothetical protein